MTETIFLLLIATLLAGYLVIVLHELSHFFVSWLIGVDTEHVAFGIGPGIGLSRKNHTKFYFLGLPAAGHCLPFDGSHIICALPTLTKLTRDALPAEVKLVTVNGLPVVGMSVDTLWEHFELGKTKADLTLQSADGSEFHDALAIPTSRIARSFTSPKILVQLLNHDSECEAVAPTPCSKVKTRSLRLFARNSDRLTAWEHLAFFSAGPVMDFIQFSIVCTFVIPGVLEINRSLHGALVVQVLSNSPAERGGLKMGDKILALNSPTADSFEYVPDLNAVVLKKGSSTEIEMLLESDGKSRRVNIPFFDRKVFSQSKPTVSYPMIGVKLRLPEDADAPLQWSRPVQVHSQLVRWVTIVFPLGVWRQLKQIAGFEVDAPVIPKNCGNTSKFENIRFSKLLPHGLLLSSATIILIFLVSLFGTSTGSDWNYMKAMLTLISEGQNQSPPPLKAEVDKPLGIVSSAITLLLFAVVLMTVLTGFLTTHPCVPSEFEVPLKEVPFPLVGIDPRPASM